MGATEMAVAVDNIGQVAYGETMGWLRQRFEGVNGLSKGGREEDRVQKPGA